MTNLLQKFEKQQIERLTSKKRIPTFRPGDTVKVTLKIVEGEKSRLQSYEGSKVRSHHKEIPIHYATFVLDFYSSRKVMRYLSSVNKKSYFGCHNLWVLAVVKML
jgi:ribosomal protein L19